MNRIRTISMFLATIVLFLILANFVVYEAVMLFLRDTIAAWLVIVILSAFSFSFIGSLVIGRKYYNFFTRIYTWLSMTWMGFFAYLFLGSVAYVLEVAVIGDPLRIIATLIYGVAVILSCYGIVHARNITIKNIDIRLNDLPAAWNNKKAVFISDLHVGQINGRKFVERIVLNIKKIDPHVVFIGGDLFDGSSQQQILGHISPFRDLLVPRGIYFVMGNHEGYGTAQVFLQKIREVGINSLRDEKVVVDGVQLIGVDYATTVEKDKFKKVLDAVHINKHMPSILLKHEPKHIGVAEQAGISLQLSGHTHKAQQWPFEYFARMTYKDFTYGLSKNKDMQVYTSSGVGTWGPPLRIGTDSEIVVITFHI